jgi:hypothetical protein
VPAVRLLTVYDVVYPTTICWEYELLTVPYETR